MRANKLKLKTVVIDLKATMWVLDLQLALDGVALKEEVRCLGVLLYPQLSVSAI